MGWKWRIAALAVIAVHATAAIASAQQDAPVVASTNERENTNEDVPANVQDKEKGDHTGDFVSWEMEVNERAAAMDWTQEPPPDTKSMEERPTLEGTDGNDDEQEVQRLQSALESIFAKMQPGDRSFSMELDPSLVEELQQLVGDAAPLSTQTVDDLPEQMTEDEASRFQQLAEQILEEWEAGDAHDSSDKVQALPIELSDEFLDIEKRIDSEGFTEELVRALQVLATERNDVYAKEKLAFMELFEPAVATRSGLGNFTDAFVNLRSAADAGVVSAMSTLALLHLVDFGVPRNGSMSENERHDAAQTLLVRLAEEDDFVSSLAVGYRYLSGKMNGMSKRACTNAVLHYHRCAQSNIHTLAEHGGEKPSEKPGRLSEEWVMSSAFANDEAHEEAAQRFEYYRTVAANPADPQWAEATEHMGETYFYGDEAAGIEPNQAVAAEHFQRAADAGDAHAQANYGMMLASGVGIPQNNATALKYFRAAAKQGSGFANYGIGILYMSGGGVKKNQAAAVYYFEKAVELGYNEAHTYLGSAYLNGQGVSMNGSKAFEHFALAAETKSSQALFNLAVMHYRGVGTPRSCELAMHNFRTVALHPEVLTHLPFSVTKGYECFQQGDYLRAFLHYRLVGELGDESAQSNAAFLLEKFGDTIFPTQGDDDDGSGEPAANGVGALKSPNNAIPWMGTTKKPLVEAYSLYLQAANLNDTEAIRKTGMCFHDEWAGVCQRNHSIALARYSLAAELGDSEAAYNCGLMYAMGDGIERSLETAKVSAQTLAFRTKQARAGSACTCVSLSHSLFVCAEILCAVQRNRVPVEYSVCDRVDRARCDSHASVCGTSAACNWPQLSCLAFLYFFSKALCVN